MAFRYQPYQSELSGSIADIIGRQSQIRANAARQSGDARARAAEIGGHAKAQMIGAAVQGGQAVLGNIGQIMQQRREAPIRAQEAALAMRERIAKIREIEDKLAASQATREEAGLAQTAIKTAMTEAGGNHQKAADWLLSQGWAQLAEQVQKAAPPAPSLHNVPANTSVIDERNPSAGAVFTSPAEPPKPPTPPSTIDGAIMEAYRSGNGAEVNRLLTLKRQSGEAGRAPEGSGAAERPSVWVAKEGEMKYVTPSQAAELSGQGWKPGNTREQGRPVTSGDAGRFAELQTSLDDVSVLSKTIKDVKGATGTLASVQAGLPNWATEMLGGWGAGAKQKQAVIDRVKQVIGKALEGGVLRKEDEIKYAKILPTISDLDTVVETKLEGLQKAIEQRLQREIDAREDAGYDVTKFRARGGSTAGPSIGERRMIDGKMGEWDGKGWKAVP